MESHLITQKKNSLVQLPDVLTTSASHVSNILSALNLPREIIASDDEIKYAWTDLGREISRIPEDLRSELIVRMCIATSVGLFDGAINYIWNATVLSLKQKVKNFGLSLVGQTLSKKFEESDLDEFRDAELLDLCRKLDLLTEEGFFFLNQCRDTRNNFSSAHPSIATIDDRELISFISRCCKHGISKDLHLQGIKIQDFISSIEITRLEDDDIDLWVERFKNTFPAQRQLLLPMMLGKYCDSSSTESTRVNILKISMKINHLFDEKVKSSIIEMYEKYRIKNDSEKLLATREYFEKLGFLTLLNTSEQHSIIRKACKNLVDAHTGFDNFYTEPPFAERLRDISIKSGLSVPPSTQGEYVYAVLVSFVGNRYGFARDAVQYNEEMIKNFSPKEIDIMLKLKENKNLLSEQIRMDKGCKARYKEALKLLDPISMNATQSAKYKSLLKTL